MLLAFGLAVGRGEANHHNGVFWADGAGVVNDAGWNGDGIARIHDDFLVAEGMLDLAGEQMQNLVAVGMTMARVGVARFDGNAPERHGVRGALRARNEPDDPAPVEI